MTDRKFYRTVIVFEILSEEPIMDMNLNEIAYHTDQGNLSGSFMPDVVTNQELNGMTAVRYLEGQGSDPSFFQLDRSGNDLEEAVLET